MDVPGAQWVKNLPAMQKMQEAQLSSLGQEDPLQDGMAADSKILNMHAHTQSFTRDRHEGHFIDHWEVCGTESVSATE